MGEKKEAINVGARLFLREDCGCDRRCEVCLGRLWILNRESDGREKWRFGLDDKNTVVRDCDS